VNFLTSTAVLRAVKAMLLMAVLVVHLLSRWYAHQHYPLFGRHNYENDYQYSLSLLAGKGLYTLGPLEGPAADPLKEFFAGARTNVSRLELAEYVQTINENTSRLGIENQYGSARILDLYLAVGLWKVFGISWNVLYLFYAGVSTGCCLLICLIGRRLGGSFWPGLFAAALFCASPLQSFLATFSLRDTSPLWFATLGFYVLICLADRFRGRRANAASFLGLGAAAVIGLGWRLDAAFLVPMLGAGLVFLLIWKRRRPVYVLAASGLFLVGAGLVFTGINALCHFQRQQVSATYHIAYYGENERCNVCGIENSLQIEFCDLQTFFDMCRLNRAVNGKDTPPPIWLSPEYYRKCKEMYLTSLRYNAFNYVRYLPAFFWRVQAGLAAPTTVQGIDHATLSALIPPWAAEVHRVIFEPLLRLLPWLVVLGAAAALLAGREPAACLCLLGFETAYVLVLFFVLPMHKHLALTLLPVPIFGGLGLWALLRLCRPRAWGSEALAFLRGRSLRWGTVGASVIVGLWGLACLGTYFLSRHERHEYLRAVVQAVQHGIPAPETIRNKQLFSVRLAAADQPTTGYLLEVRAGSQPGLAVCRNLHHPTTVYWGKVNWTYHRLQPNRTQYMFVSCRQGGSAGDDRPYACTVALDGTAEIVASTRVDLSEWKRLPFSTVFAPGDRHAGSPRVQSPSSGWLFSQVAVSGRSALTKAHGPGSPGAQETLQGVLNHLTARNLETGEWRFALSHATPCTVESFRGVLHHLSARNLDTGEWRFALTNGHWSNVLTLGGWDAGLPWYPETLLGDFDGDGLQDIVGLVQSTGGLWVARFDGARLQNDGWAIASPPGYWTDLAVGDFNGDGLDDLFLRNAKTGALTVALSTGKSFALANWGQGPKGAAWRHVKAADFDGDGRTDVAGYDAATGTWWLARSTGSGFELRPWGHWPAEVDWQHVCVGDFNGDGRCDLAAWDPRTGQWWLALGGPDGFRCQAAATTDPADRWVEVGVGDVNGDGRDALVGRSETGACWVGLLEEDQLFFETWGNLPGTPQDLCVADLDGDRRADIAWRDRVTGELWVGLARGDAFQFECWGHWPPAERLTRMRAYRAWK
jgi:hypothetical protein